MFVFWNFLEIFFAKKINLNARHLYVLIILKIFSWTDWASLKGISLTQIPAKRDGYKFKCYFIFKVCARFIEIVLSKKLSETFFVCRRRPGPGSSGNSSGSNY